MVRVLDADPELAADLPCEAFEQARREALAPMVTVNVGAWDWQEHADAPSLGLLVLDGLLARSESIGELAYMEFLGAGDLLRPWCTDAQERTPGCSSWRVIVRSRMALLDHDFALRTRAWPEISAALLDRVVVRARSLGVALAIRQASRLERRIHLMLWHLAGRWGYVTQHGTVLPIPLTHELLARLVGASRSPVTVALGELRRKGLVERGPGRFWLLREYPEIALDHAARTKGWTEIPADRGHHPPAVGASVD